MAIFGERAAPSVNLMYYVHHVYLLFWFLFQFGFDGWIVVVFARVPDHCLPLILFLTLITR